MRCGVLPRDYIVLNLLQLNHGLLYTITLLRNFKIHHDMFHQFSEGKTVGMTIMMTMLRREAGRMH